MQRLKLSFNITHDKKIMLRPTNDEILFKKPIDRLFRQKEEEDDGSVKLNHLNWCTKAPLCGFNTKWGKQSESNGRKTSGRALVAEKASARRSKLSGETIHCPVPRLRDWAIGRYQLKSTKKESLPPIQHFQERQQLECGEGERALEAKGKKSTPYRLALGRAHTREPTLSRIRAPVDSETAIVVNGGKARERESKKPKGQKEEQKQRRCLPHRPLTIESLSLRQRDSLFLEQARRYLDKILAEAEKEEEKEERTATITSLDELQLCPFVNEGIERPAKGSTAEFQDYETNSWD
ncbi:hypothetical protein L1987_45934 [Smallanthus sonchifolius]|uniref:Uncharacterized protein n=1 Tax=Smallanthus sonchifolius TaxID=185202 RepID=A0ACB9FYF5_9ASTR|nr:hypothetical protein L1987_45934 [Smallanthus sonchifolius]